MSNKISSFQFNILSNELVSLQNYSEFCDKLYSIDLDTLSEEQLQKLYDLLASAAEDKGNQTMEEEQYGVRQIAINHIMELDFETFQQRMKIKRMPEFVRAKKDDNDYYIHIKDDDNQEQGWLRAYNHRSELLFVEYKDFIACHVFTDDEFMDYIIMEIANEIIPNYTKEQIYESIHNDPISVFVKSIKSKPIYKLLLSYQSTSYNK